MKLSKLFFVVAIIMVAIPFISGCALTEVQQQELDNATQQVLNGVSDGSLSINDAKLLLGEIDDLRGSDYSWWEIGGAIIAGVLGLRGIPSKGPIRWGINLLGGLFGGKKKK